MNSIFEFDVTPGYLIPTRRRSRKWCRICWCGIGALVGFIAGVLL